MQLRFHPFLPAFSPFTGDFRYSIDISLQYQKDKIQAQLLLMGLLAESKVILNPYGLCI